MSINIQRHSLKDPGVRQQVDAGVITYIGRDFAGLRNIGLGNPYKPQPHEAKGVTLKRYETWLIQELRMHNPRTLAALQQVAKTQAIACWCKTHEVCHGDVVIRLATAVHEATKDQDG